MLTPQKAQELQDTIYQQMTASQKLKIVGQMFLLGKKLSALNDKKLYVEQGNRNNSRNFALPNSENSG